jgi:hypothetical protein
MAEEMKPAAAENNAVGASPRPTGAATQARLAAGDPPAQGAEGAGAGTAQGAPGQPFLPASFFSKLVHQPSCITKGVCDNCGRCEH